MISFELDERKRTINIEKHGIDFVDAKEIWLDSVIEFQSTQSGHGEVRYVAIGILKADICIAVIFTWREHKRRIISAKRARNNEKALYEHATWGRS